MMTRQRVNFIIAVAWVTVCLLASNVWPRLMPANALSCLLAFGACGLVGAFVMSIAQAKLLVLTEGALMAAGETGKIDRGREAYLLEVGYPVVAGQFLAGLFTNYIYVRAWQGADFGDAFLVSFHVAAAFACAAALGIALGVAAFVRWHRLNGNPD